MSKVTGGALTKQTAQPRQVYGRSDYINSNILLYAICISNSFNV